MSATSEVRPARRRIPWSLVLSLLLATGAPVLGFVGYRMILTGLGMMLNGPGGGGGSAVLLIGRMLQRIAWLPWTAWRAIGLPEPLQHPSFTQSIFGAAGWGLLGAGIGTLLDLVRARKLRRKLADRDGSAPSRHLRTAAVCAVLLLVVGTLPWLLPPIFIVRAKRGLSSPDPRTREEAVCRLEALEPLGMGWGDNAPDDVYERLRERAHPLLVSALSDEDVDVRIRATRVIGLLGVLPEESVDALLGAAQDDNGSVRYTAFHALRAVDVSSARVARALCDGLKDPDNAVRHAAVFALQGTCLRRPETVGPLLEALDDDYVRLVAADALSRRGAMGREAVPVLIEWLRTDPDPSVRSSAARDLGRMGESSQVVVDALIAALQDEDVRVVESAAEALGGFGAAARQALGPLKEVTDKNDSDVVREAIRLIESSGK